MVILDGGGSDGDRFEKPKQLKLDLDLVRTLLDLQALEAVGLCLVFALFTSWECDAGVEFSTLTARRPCRD